MSGWGIYTPGEIYEPGENVIKVTGNDEIIIKISKKRISMGTNDASLSYKPNTKIKHVFVVTFEDDK